MSVLSVANVHFETTGANRIEYIDATDDLKIFASGNISISSRNFTISNTVGPSGNVLVSNGTSWTSQALPSSLFASGPSGNVLTSNGSTWVSTSLQVLPSTGSSGNVLTSNGTSWISQVPAPTGLTITNETASSSTYYPTLSTATTGNIVNANTSSSKLYFTPSTGTLAATVFNSLSDEKHKTNIQTIENPLELTAQLRGVWFNWADTGAPSMGLIAQEVEKVLPQIVSENKGIKTLNYDAIIGLLIEDIKILKDKIEKLENNA